MKASIEVESKKDAELIRKGLADPATRALVKVMGALQTLPSDRSRRRVMMHVQDYLAEEAETGAKVNPDRISRETTS